MQSGMAGGWQWLACCIRGLESTEGNSDGFRHGESPWWNKYTSSKFLYDLLGNTWPQVAQLNWNNLAISEELNPV